MRTIFLTSALVLTFLTSCDSSSQTVKNVSNAAQPKPEITKPEPRTPRKPVAKVPDFKNYDYPIVFESVKELAPKLRQLKFRDGKLDIEKKDLLPNEHKLMLTVGSVSLKDLDGDGFEEALVSLGITYFQGHGSALLLFDLRKTPRIVWSREFGDGAFGGERKIRFTDDGLLIEEYSSGRARMMPTAFKTTRYRYMNGKIKTLDSFETKVDLDHVEFLGDPCDFEDYEY